MKNKKNKNVLTCVYCGHEYPSGTPSSGPEFQVLTEHIKFCDKHPMREAERKITILRVALEGLVGAASKTDLEAMHKKVSMMPPCDEQRSAMGGITALLQTL